MPPLSIAYDAQLWDEPTTGIGLYARELARALEDQGVTLRKLGARKSGDDPRGSLGKTAYTIARLPIALREAPEPLYHALANVNLPLQRVAGKRFVLTVHDLIPELFPETVSRAFRWQFRLWLGRSLRLADQVICVSARTRDDLLARYDYPAERTHVVHNGVDHVGGIDRPGPIASEYLKTLGLSKRFVLYAGALDVRKNVAAVLDACERLWARGVDAPLVLVGQSWFGSGPVEERITLLRAAGRPIQRLGFLEDELFFAVLKRASVFVFPSLYEGFGLPPLEAMWHGVPAVVSNTGSLPEVCGAAALQVDPRDSAALAGAIERILCSVDEREEWSEKARAHAIGFTWRRAAEQTIAVYRAALEQPQR